MSTLAVRDRAAPLAGEVRRRRDRHLTLWLGLGLAMVVLASCTRNRAHVDPPVGIPGSFAAAGEAAMPEKWWMSFGDARLDPLLKDALRGNFSLRVAWDRLDVHAGAQDLQATATSLRSS